MGAYKIVDMIFGKQRSYAMGRGTSGVKFKVFPEALQDKIRDYTAEGGSVMASGCYVASDLWYGPDADGEDKGFARGVLHYSFSGDMATRRGQVRTVASPMNMPRLDINFNREPSATHYGVESPGIILPAGRDAFIAMRYPKSNQSAAVGYKGKDYRSFVMAFPFESILDEGQRDKLMLGVLNFLSQSGGAEVK
ncbi:MAG: xanthan lyase, partial [Alistipes sp.]|nr:xanthan lyase [Alistipes sp.]